MTPKKETRRKTDTVPGALVAGIPQLIISVIFIVGYFYALSVIAEMVNNEIEVPEALLVLLSGLFGVLTATIAGIVQFYFKRKDR